MVFSCLADNILQADAMLFAYTGIKAERTPWIGCDVGTPDAGFPQHFPCQDVQDV
jgi:hypothetical protein